VVRRGKEGIVTATTAYRASRFLLEMTRDAPPHAPVWNVRLGDGAPAAVYEPTDPVCGVLLLAHGMTDRGADDPRIVRLARALAHAGYRVVLPTFDEIRDARIRGSSVGDVAEAIEVVARHGGLGARRPIGVIGPSFSGAIALRAVSRVSALVSTVLAIGAFHDPRAVIEHLMLEDEVDPYGRYVVLSNYLPLSSERDPMIEDAVRVAIADDQRPSKLLPRHLEALSHAQRHRFELLTNDPAGRRDVLERVRRLLAAELGAIAVDPRHIDVPVVLLHGRDDRVIPADQSRSLHRRIRAHGGDSTLVVTPLLSHGDLRLGPALLMGALPLVRAFARFFQLVEDGARARALPRAPERVPA
jgi:pimeloyl-ACP methyl ester carboxylesterase